MPMSRRNTTSALYRPSSKAMPWAAAGAARSNAWHSTARIHGANIVRAIVLMDGVWCVSMCGIGYTETQPRCLTYRLQLLATVATSGGRISVHACTTHGCSSTATGATPPSLGTHTKGASRLGPRPNVNRSRAHASAARSCSIDCGHPAQCTACGSTCRCCGGSLRVPAAVIRSST